MVAAVVAGDADGFAAVYDQYATSLYACCHAVLPEPEAAGAVLDTFLIATVKLDGLRDPDRLGPWLHAVARNECLRRLGPARRSRAAIPAAIRAAADHGGEPPEVPLPADLRGQVLTACADNSPAGRAHRMSVAHRAGVFGPAGFPKAIGSSGPWWWRRVRRHPGVVAAAAAVAALAVTAGITVALTAGGSHRPQASGLGLGGGAPTPASSTSPGATSPGTVPGAHDPGLDSADVAGGASRRDQRRAIDGAGHARARHVTVRHVAVPVALAVQLARPGIPAGGAGQADAHLEERDAGQRVLRAHRRERPGLELHRTGGRHARPGHGRPGGRISPWSTGTSR